MRFNYLKEFTKTDGEKEMCSYGLICDDMKA